MPRIARKYLESCYFHVIVQGYERQYIFESDKFIRKYMELLFDNLCKFKVTILAYCIMNNHAHILLYCEKTTEMSLYMKNVNTQYAMFYNKIKRRVGYVFRDRFLSEAINNVRYLYACLNYIHMNPVAANIVKKPNQYKFSSYQNFLNKIKRLGVSGRQIEKILKIDHRKMKRILESASIAPSQ